MPFTLSHPAAAVPFYKYGLPLSALVVGSMAPDFPYFLDFSTSNQYGHTLQGLFVFCLPAGWVVLWLFHRILKLPLLSLLPAKHQERVVSAAGEFDFGPSFQFLRIIFALLLGAFTHIVWDSFTHGGGAIVRHLSFLHQPLVKTPYGTLYLFKILQHGSTLFGAILLLFWYARWFKNAKSHAVELPIPFSEASKRRFILFMALIGVLLTAVRSYLTTPFTFDASGLETVGRSLAVGGIAILFIELVVFSGIWHIQAARRTAK